MNAAGGGRGKPLPYTPVRTVDVLGGAGLASPAFRILLKNA